ncbi:MAG: SDR family oxidoreductase [Rhodothermaceae bacterium]|nr:SDR family oxidoreductase [Rhodothermaceae bacterium]
MFKNDTLEGKTILVTGGGSGLGLAMAKAFSSLGARVAICGRNEDRLKSAAGVIGASGNPVYTSAVDVRDYEAVSDMMDGIETHFGALNGLVNNAAGNFLFPSEDLSPNAFKTVVDIVLHGTFNCTQHFGKRLIDSGNSGTILNIVTTYTQTGSAFVLPSACAKAGVLAMTNSLAAEWAEYNIRVNSIAPGPFPTEGAWTRLMPDPKIEEAYLKKIPAGRYGEHDELANLAVFLMSDLSPYITGECVTIDGGESLMAGQFNSLMQIAPRKQLKGFFQMMKPKK